MRTFKQLWLTGILAITLSLAFSITVQAATKIGVIAPRGALKTMKRWSEFSKYLEARIGDSVEIRPYSPNKIIAAAKAGEVDFMLSNPTQAVILQEVYGAQPLATLNKGNGSKFAGVIVAKKGSGIVKAEDLRSKKVMALKFRSSAGAYTFQTYHLQKKGIDAHNDFASFKEGKKQDDLVLAVKAGIIDAAFVRSGILEAMEQEGKIKLDEFVVVDQRKDNDLPLLHTTALYPEWYLSRLKNTDPALSEKVKAAALNIKPQDKAAQTAKIKGFVEPVPMDSMKAALKALKIKPYDQ